MILANFLIYETASNFYLKRYLHCIEASKQATLFAKIMKKYKYTVES